MKRFARLAEALAFMPSDEGKRRLLADYAATVPDPDRGWGLAVLLGVVNARPARPAVLRALAARRTDPALFALSHGFVGDLAETLALMWPDPPPRANSLPPSIAEVAAALGTVPRGGVEELLEGWLDTLDAVGRYTLLKLAGGTLRVDVGPRLVMEALAAWGGVDVHAVEECWHSLTPPYEPLFAWLERRGPRPAADGGAVFRPVMPALPLGDGEPATLDLAAWVMEWQWDGLRVQLVGHGGQRAVYGRNGEDLSAHFPEIAAAVTFDGAVEGELLAAAEEGPPFTPLPAAAIQPRLKRTAKVPSQPPVFVRLFDMLAEGAEDLRPLPFAARRARLEHWFAAASSSPRLELSPLLPLEDWETARRLHDGIAGAGVRGLMLKRRDAAYDPAGAGGAWRVWKRRERTVRAVLMYGQRGAGPGAAAFDSYTAGVRRGADLLPVGKAAAALPDADRRDLDRWIAANTVNRVGPVREVPPELVVEVGFDAAARSTRHKCGLVLRAPCIRRVCWGEPAATADTLAVLEAMVDG